MQVLFKKVLSIHEDGASCHLIIIQESYKIMLDCGINHFFDFHKYQQIAHELKDVKLVLISHSALEYSGAYPFLISELNMNPKIFYTTQPIMRYAPLNLHEEILNLRLEGYDKKIFNRIYTQYEEMNLVKPYQKQEVELNTTALVNPLLQKKENLFPIKKVHFCCYLAGGYLGSVYWRISYGLVNILYLVDYNNYNMFHIGGLDIDNLKNQTAHLLITDVYAPTDRDTKKDKLYVELKQKLMNFYQKNGVDPNRPKSFNLQHDTKLLISCYPNELVVEVLATMRKIISQLEGNHEKIEKIGVVHLSSRFLELVKSQSEYFQTEFKGMLERLTQFFEQSLSLNKRINICTLSSIRGILLDEKNSNTEVYHIGINDLKQCKDKSVGIRNLRPMRIFDKQDMRLQKSASKLSVSKIEQQAKKQQNDNQMDVQYSIDDIKAGQQYENFDDDQMKEQVIEKKHIKSKYISSVNGFPKFTFSKLEKDEEITEFGLRHHTDIADNMDRKTIYDCKPGEKLDTFQDKFAKKQSKIEVMNIHFELPSEHNNLSHFPITNFADNIYKTEFESSLKLIQLIRPNNIIFVNTPPNSSTFRNYQNNIDQFANSYGDVGHKGKRVRLFDSNVKKNCYLQFQNELLEYRMNYLAETQEQKVQRVRGRIVKQGNSIHIHLECLQNKKIVSFRLEKFYSKMKQKMRCKFMGSGVQIEGIKVYRRDKQIILQGDYSEQYFKVRKELYEFLGIR